MKLKTAVAIIYNPQGEFLIQDRRKRSKWGEDYGLFGGKIEKNETPEEAIIREIYEELTFDLRKWDFEFFKTQSEKDLKLKNNDFQVERSSYIFKMPDLGSLIVREGEPAIITLDRLPNIKMIGSQSELLTEAYKYLTGNGEIR